MGSGVQTGPLSSPQGGTVTVRHHSRAAPGTVLCGCLATCQDGVAAPVKGLPPAPSPVAGTA